jgi:hypothetical protein
MIIALSALAFVFGMITIIVTWKSPRCGFIHARQRSLH